MQRKQIYRIGVAVFIFAVFQSPASYLIFGEIEKGRVVETVFEYPGITLLPSSSYPKIEFTYHNKFYIIRGEENENLLVGEQVKVIFFKDNPSKAKVLTFGGLFINSIIQLPIGLLIWWALFKSFPNLFNTSKDSSSFEDSFNKHRVRREDKISDSPAPTKFLIFAIVAVIALFLLYAIWNIYKEIISEKIYF